MRANRSIGLVMQLTSQQGREQALTVNSYYEATVTRPSTYAKLQGRHETDVCIVGGGLAGLSAAIDLAQSGFKVLVLEANRFGWGASGRNGGQALVDIACGMETILAQVGPADAKRVWQFSLDALDLIHERRAQFDIDCDWQVGYLAFAKNARKAAALRKNTDYYARHFGFDQTRWIPPNELSQWIASPTFHSGVLDPISGHLHPLKYLLGLVAAAQSLGVVLCEGSVVLTADDQGLVCTAEGQVQAKKVLLAGNVYLDHVAPQLRPRIMPVGTYIGTTTPLSAQRINALIPSRAAVCDTNFVLDYFRPTIDNRLLMGGLCSYSTRTPSNLQATMRGRVHSVFPQLADVEVDFVWGGFVDITMNRAPDFGRIGSNTYYLQGFSGHGLALTGIAGRLAAKAIAGDASGFDVFAKINHRPFPGGRLLRMPSLVLAMAWFRLMDIL